MLFFKSKKAKHHHKLDPASPPFSPYQTPASPQHVHPSSHLGMHQSTLHQSHSSQFAHPSTQGGMSTPDELLFFDRAKKTLESRETYEEFLRLLNMFSKDVIDAKTLVGRVQLFLGDGELLNQFKELIGWDDKQESVEHGPPGSVRTGPPEALSAPFVEDGQGPSYRKLPESVGGLLHNPLVLCSFGMTTGGAAGMLWPR
jgi:paired amphipathic helix protein Sin3a